MIEFKEGKKHGHGTFTFPDGLKYVGEFKEGKSMDTGNILFQTAQHMSGDSRKESMEKGRILMQMVIHMLGIQRWARALTRHVIR